MFISVGWFLHDPATLLASTVLYFGALITLIFQKKLNIKNDYINYVIISLPVMYLISAVQNGLTYESFILGGYKRNFGLATFLAVAAIFIVITSRNSEIKDFFRLGLIPTAILANIYGYIQYFDLDPFPWSNPLNAVSLTLANPNFASSLFGFINILLFAKILKHKKIKIKIFLLVSLASSIFLTLQTKSLQGVLISIVGILIFGYVLNLRRAGKVYQTINVGFYLIFTSLGFLLLSIFVSDRFQGIKQKLYYEGSVIQRLDYWRTGFEIWRDHPIFGVGIDQFQKYAPLYRTTEQIRRDGNFVIPDKAHNVFIDHFANGGVFVGLIWLIFVLLVFRISFRFIKTTQQLPLDFAILVAIWTGYVLQSFISPDHILLTAIGIMSAGSIVATSNAKRIVLTEKRSSNANSQYYFKILSITILLVSTLVYTKALIANSQAKQVMEQKLTGAENYMRVLESWPNAKFTEELGIDVLRDTSNCLFGVQVAERLIEIDSRSSQGWYMKAICANSQGEFTSALQYIERSLEYDPLNTNYLVAKAKLEIAANEIEMAVTTLEQIKRIDPNQSEVLSIEKSLQNLMSAQP
jgi:hypothetical protein